MTNTHDNTHHIRWLTYMMFFMFAMTSDAVGVIIPELIEEFDLTMTQASAFHYAPMALIAISGLLLGCLADKFGRKAMIVLGLMLFALACFSFAIGKTFEAFLVLLCVIGAAIGLFKTAALALLGDICKSNPEEHTRSMNKVEGFFAIGAIVGPALVSYLLTQEVSWTVLYLVAGCLCVLLALFTLKTQFPSAPKPERDEGNSGTGLKDTLLMLKNPYALGFSFVIALYVATEVAIYVWMPTLLGGYEGQWLWMATYALSLFFVLRALGRFLGVWLLQKFSWQSVMAALSGAITLCFALTILHGTEVAIWLLPLSGLFMSMIYPTLNSKGISCFERHHHGAAAGVILFFTALSAAVAPLIMGAVSDHFGHVSYGFMVATGFAALLFLAMLLNWLYDPAKDQLAKLSASSKAAA